MGNRNIIYRLTIDASVFGECDMDGVFNWLMEVKGFKRSLRLEQVAVWFARRDTVVYDSTDVEHIDSLCESLDGLDIPYERKTVENGV